MCLGILKLASYLGFELMLANEHPEGGSACPIPATTHTWSGGKAGLIPNLLVHPFMKPSGTILADYQI